MLINQKADRYEEYGIAIECCDFKWKRFIFFILMIV